MEEIQLSCYGTAARYSWILKGKQKQNALRRHAINLHKLVSDEQDWNVRNIAPRSEHSVTESLSSRLPCFADGNRVVAKLFTRVVGVYVSNL
jgi:hypothetical protein